MAVAVLFVSIGFVSAFGGNHVFGDRQAIHDAIESDDYDGWRMAITESLTEERFEQVKERCDDRESFAENRDAIETAIDAEDFDAWKVAMEEINSDIILDEYDFNTVLNIKDAIEENDFETARKLSENIDFEMHLGPQMFGAQGMHEREHIGMRGTIQ